MKLDIIIPVKTSLVTLTVERTIPSILTNLLYNNIYVVTNKDNFSSIQFYFGNKIKYIDEDKVCSGLTSNAISNYFKLKNIDIKRSNWYFQQFLKLSISKLDFISESYLIWDADAVVLKPIKFISKEGKVYLNKTSEHHKPYFETMEKLIGIKKQVNYSFISEYMVFRKEIVLSILNKISKKKEQHWWFTILDNINQNDLLRSGFSEYELYGNFIAKYYPNTFSIKNLNKTRNGAIFLGTKPSTFGLKLFSYVFYYISFEEWQKGGKLFSRKYFKALAFYIGMAGKRILKMLRGF